MTQLIINTGITPNDRNGDSLRAAFIKINTNFTDLYNSVGQITFGAFEFNGNTLTTTDSTPVTVNQSLSVSGNATISNALTVSSGTAHFGALTISNNTISTTDSSAITVSQSVIASTDVIIQGNLIAPNIIIPGPYASDVEANSANVKTGSIYYMPSGQVVVKLT